MKYHVNCPNCGSYALRAAGDEFRCSTCAHWFSETKLLRYMREKPYIDRDAPAFRQLDRVKPKAVSEAARTIFGTVGGQ